MSETAKDHSCDNCGSKYQLIFDIDEVSYEPDNCPFCGDVITEQEQFSFSNDDMIDWDEDLGKLSNDDDE